jgi:hypothetical protein
MRLAVIFTLMLALAGCEETYIDRYNRVVAIEHWTLIQPPPGHEKEECWRSFQAVVCFPGGEL